MVLETSSNGHQKYNGIYYYDVMLLVNEISNSILNYDIFPGKILVNLVELPDIDPSKIQPLD